MTNNKNKITFNETSILEKQIEMKTNKTVENRIRNK